MNPASRATVPITRTCKVMVLWVSLMLQALRLLLHWPGLLELQSLAWHCRVL